MHMYKDLKGVFPWIVQYVILYNRFHDVQMMVKLSDHLRLNLLALGETKDSNLLPTLLEVEPVSVTVSTLPVKTFSFPILKSTQLSFLIILSSFRAGLEVVTRGDSQGPQDFLFESYGTMSSSSSIPSSKQGCFRASTADILSLGFFFSILASRLRALGSRLLYSYPSKVMLLARFWANTQLQVFPGKALTPRSRMWKISPRLNISQMGSYFVLMSLMLMTSGATQPGVPQRTKRQSGSSENQASPKSATTQSQLPSCLKMRFSGLRSRCMIFLECISLSPRRMEETISLVSLGLNLYLALTLSYRSPPSRSSTTMQRELSDSKTSKSFMQFLWLRLLMISISLMRHSLPLSSLQAASFEKAFTAQFFPLSSFSARYTEAKFPFPIFFLGLNCSWNPRWFIFPDRISRHLLRSPSECRKQLAFSSIFSSNTVAGLTMNENLSQKSKWMYTFPLVFDYTMHLSYSAMCTSPY